MITNNKNQYGLTNRDMKTVQDIFRKYPDVKEVYLFGSRAKGNYKTGSDIDFAIMNEGVDSKTITKLLADFTESSLPFTVDLINFPTLKHTDLINHINRVGIVFYKIEIEDKKIVDSESTLETVNEPSADYAYNRIVFFNSFEEENEFTYKERASTTPLENFKMVTSMIKQHFQKQLKENPTLGNRIYFDNQ